MPAPRPRGKTPPRRTLLAPDVRRQQLLDAATWVFARKGYRHASIGDIIARAGVARGTFYLHFKSKEQIFLAIVESFHGLVKAALARLDDGADAAARAGGAMRLLQESFQQWLELFATHRDATRVVLKEARSIDPRFEQGYAELRRMAVAHFAERVRTLQRLGFARTSIDPVLVAHLQLGMFDELLEAFLLSEASETADLAVLAKQLAEFEWLGIASGRSPR